MWISNRVRNMTNFGWFSGPWISRQPPNTLMIDNVKSQAAVARQVHTEKQLLCAPTKRGRPVNLKITWVCLFFLGLAPQRVEIAIGRTSMVRDHRIFGHPIFKQTHLESSRTMEVVGAQSFWATQSGTGIPAKLVSVRCCLIWSHNDKP